ncbi:hypothetical protein ACFWDW_26660, partial [Streptomyces roseolus]|uniref:hypothetical protein n=2 Tax=Streptomyces roseolus TaxID=67358 RepID=UPI00364BFC8C
GPESFPADGGLGPVIAPVIAGLPRALPGSCVTSGELPWVGDADLDLDAYPNGAPVAADARDRTGSRAARAGSCRGSSRSVTWTVTSGPIR